MSYQHAKGLKTYQNALLSMIGNYTRFDLQVTLTFDL